MNIRWHLIASLAILAASLPFNQSAPFLTVELSDFKVTVFFLCLALDVLVDIDHLIDYRVNRWHMSESLESRFRNGRMFVVFHRVENIPILIALSIAFPFLVFPTANYACHIMMDAFSNGVSFQAYFYTVRFGKRLTHSASKTR